MIYKIHRLCRDTKTIEKLKEEEKKFNLPKTEYVTGIDLFTFINYIIRDCKEDYALICHDDVILPLNISENVELCIKSANDFLGEDKWGMIGNAGIEVFTKRVLLHLSDPNIRTITPPTYKPQLAESIDGNIMLLNLKNIRSKKIRLPKNLKGFHLYDLILSLEIQKKGLVCAISSLLYVTHLSGGSRDSFSRITNNKLFQNYFAKNFSNNTISTINGEITIKNHVEKSKLPQIEELVMKNALQLFKTGQFRLYFLIYLNKKSKKFIRLLNSIHQFQQQLPEQVHLYVRVGIDDNNKILRNFIEILKQNEYKTLDITIVALSNRNRFLQEIIEELSNSQNSFISVLSYDSFLLPDFAHYLQYALSTSKIVLAQTNIYKTNSENKRKDFGSLNLKNKTKTLDVDLLYSGRPNISTNSLILNLELAKGILQEDAFVPHGLENYFLFLLSSKYETYKYFPIPFIGTTHSINTKDSSFLYDYTSLMAQITQKNIISSNLFNFIMAENDRLQFILDQSIAEFAGFKEGLIWKSLIKYRQIRSWIKKFFS